MFGIVFSALARRRAPAFTLLLLTILAAGAAAAAPQYVVAATRDVATADLAASPAGGPVVTFGKTLDGRVGAEGRDGQDFAVVAGDGTVQLPPEVLGAFPPGTLFSVDHEGGAVTLVAGGSGATTGGSVPAVARQLGEVVREA